MLLTPIEPASNENRVNLNSAGSCLTYKVSGKDWANIQLVPGGVDVWPASAVITVQVSNDGNAFHNFPAGAETLTAFGVVDLFVVTGFEYIRLLVTTAGGAAGHAIPCITAGVDLG